MNVDRAGTFRAEVVDSGLGQTRKAGYPQLNINAKLIEYYDEDTEKWVDWSEYNQEVDCRLCLFGLVGKDKKLGTTLTYDQACKVFNWDGADLLELTKPKIGIKFQVRVEDNDPEYADKTPFQVNWIDVYDANPTRKMDNCTLEEVKGLQAKYAALLKAKAKPVAPVKAPKKAANGKSPLKAPPKIPTVTATTSSKVTTPVGNYTKTAAWRSVVELKNDDISDEELGIIWQKAIHDVSNGAGEDVLNGAGWWNVKEMVLDTIGLPF